MPLLLPNLDDRSWADLADEGRSLIPVYGPEWTDHNASDPGITIVELLAWITEMDIYRLNQVSDVERLRFLALVGVKPRAPQPAAAVLSIGLAGTVVTPVPVPRGVEFSGRDGNGVETRYQTRRDIVLAPGSLLALQQWTPAGFQNLTPGWLRRLALLPFGPTPDVGGAFYLGLSAALPVNSPTTLYFTFGDGSSGLADRRRIVEEIENRERRCLCAQPDNVCGKSKAAETNHRPKNCADKFLTHYGVRTVWEYLASSGGTTAWRPLNPSNAEVVDETRAFTLDGPVTFRVPSAMALSKIGGVSAPLFYLRCRIDAGRYDSAPILTDVAFNGVRAVQKAPWASSFIIDAKCSITYGPGGAPTPNQWTGLRLQFDALGRIIRLDFTAGAKTDAEFLVLDFKAPAGAAAGYLILEAAFLGYGSGFPKQQVTLPGAPVDAHTVHVYTQEKGSWFAWELREDFLASTRRDFHAVLDATTGILTFGNGEKGRVPPELKGSAPSPGDCLIFAVLENTRAQDGNLAAGHINTLTDSPHNRALLYDPTANPDGWKVLKSELGPISNHLVAARGTAAETIALAAGRADTLVGSSRRAVTLQDYERLAAETPGTRISRVTAIANLHPNFPCFKAPGMITVIVVPSLPAGRPLPTPGLLQAVASYLRPRRVIGTRVEVVGPTYLEVTVNATVQSRPGTEKTNLQQTVLNALNTFLDPLVGGPAGSGWPFGRDVYRAEIMKIISEVEGVNYVTSLELIPGQASAQCGNICLGATWLVAAGTHQIQVL